MEDEELKEAWKGCDIQNTSPEMFDYTKTTLEGYIPRI